MAGQARPARNRPVGTAAAWLGSKISCNTGNSQLTDHRGGRSGQDRIHPPPPTAAKAPERYAASCSTICDEDDDDEEDDDEDEPDASEIMLILPLS